MGLLRRDRSLNTQRREETSESLTGLGLCSMHRSKLDWKGLWAINNNAVRLLGASGNSYWPPPPDKRLGE